MNSAQQAAQVLRADCGMHMSITVNFICEETGQRGKVDYQFGINKRPTKTQVDEAIVACLAQVQEAVDGKPVRMTSMGDFGLATPKDFDWKMGG